MGREIRRVPSDWKHPLNERTGRPRPLHEGYAKELAAFQKMYAEKGLQETLEYMGAPDIKDYMPEWSEEQRTHLMMYETCSEGTPISPAFVTPEELASWLADNKASALGYETATYEEWLSTCREGWAPSGIYTPGKGFRSGVAASNDNK